jgi:hypothetical protein
MPLLSSFKVLLLIAYSVVLVVQIHSFLNPSQAFILKSGTILFNFKRLEFWILTFWCFSFSLLVRSELGFSEKCWHLYSHLCLFSFIWSIFPSVTLFLGYGDSLKFVGLVLVLNKCWISFCIFLINNCSQGILFWSIRRFYLGF